MDVDGSIKIDTRISDAGFNAGLKKVSASAHGALNNVLFSTLKIGTAIKGVFSSAAQVVGSLLKGIAAGLLVFFAVTAQKIFAFLREAVAEAIKLTPAIQEQFEQLKGTLTEVKVAIGNAFAPLVSAALPFLQMVADKLLEIFNVTAQITAAFLGQKQALQIMPGSAAKLAKEAEKTKKAAQGALAAFDQINVLQKQQTDTNDLPKVEAQMMPITDDILTKVQAIKDEIAQWFADPIGKLQETWGKVVAWFQENVFNPIAAWWEDTWLDKNIVEPFVKWFSDAWERIALGASESWKRISLGASAVWEDIKALWENLAPLFEIWWDTVVNIVKERVTFIKEIIASITQVLHGVLQFVVGAFTQDWQAAWQGIAMVFEGVWTGIKAFLKLTINSYIDLINGLLRAVVLGINAIGAALSNLNFTVPEWVPGLGGSAFDISIPQLTAPQIPRLATGAVIPPNAEFAAILGDNKRENEILAPESKLMEMMQAVADRAGGTFDITVNLDGEVIYRNQQKVQMRHGKSLLAGGVVR